MTRAAPGWTKLRRSLTPRHVIVLLCALAMLWLCMAVGAANVLRGRNPDTALRFAPFDAQAHAVAAERLVVSGGLAGSRLDEVEQLSRAALARDPTLVTAWRSLAAVRDVQGRRPQAATLFHFAERLSRRDLLTQLWLIEERVGANDVPGALAHYNIALRTSARSGSFLLPILAQATSEPAVVAPLVRILRTRPAWRNDFLYEMSQRAPSPATLVAIVEGLGSPGDLPASTMALTVDRLVAQRAYAEAWRLYARLRPAQAGNALLRQPGFETAGTGYSFEWRFEDGANLGAQPVAMGADGSGIVLAVRADEGDSGKVASQLLRLAPGRYTIGARSGALPDVAPTRFTWRMTCAGSNVQDLVGPGQPGGSAILPSMTITVPAAGCPAQWLELHVRTGTEAEHAGGWIDDVRIARTS